MNWRGFEYFFASGFLVLAVGVIFIFLYKPLRNDCEIHVENFFKRFERVFISQKGKSVVMPPLLRGALDRCRNYNNRGACWHLVELMTDVVRFLRDFEPACYSALSKQPMIVGALGEFLKLWVRIAWDEYPPPRRVFCHESCWFEVSDFALFCKVKKAYQDLVGFQKYQEFERQILSELPGLKPEYNENNECINCDKRPLAVSLLGFEEVRLRSLFGVSCAQF